MTIKPQDIVRIERLARLRLPEASVKSFAARLSGVFDWIDQLHEVDTEGVTPFGNPSEVIGPTTPARQDAVDDTDRSAEVLQNAPEQERNFYLVPKIID